MRIKFDPEQSPKSLTINKKINFFTKKTFYKFFVFSDKKKFKNRNIVLINQKLNVHFLKLFEMVVTSIYQITAEDSGMMS